MKKILQIISLLIVSCNLAAQNGDVRGRRIIANQQILLRDYRIDSLVNDTVGWAVKYKSLPTAKAVYDFVHNRTIGGGGADGNNYTTGLSFNNGTGLLTLNRSGLGNLTADIDGRYWRLSDTAAKYWDWGKITGVPSFSKNWQNTLTYGSVLTQNNTVDVDGYNFIFSDAQEFSVQTRPINVCEPTTGDARFFVKYGSSFLENRIKEEDYRALIGTNAACSNEFTYSYLVGRGTDIFNEFRVSAAGAKLTLTDTMHSFDITNLPKRYNTGNNLFRVGYDSVLNKLVRYTESASVPSLQEVLNVGSTATINTETLIKRDAGGGDVSEMLVNIGENHFKTSADDYTTFSSAFTDYSGAELRFSGTDSLTRIRAEHGKAYVTGGKLGVGINNPTARLHVNGSVRFVTGGEAANKVLTSDASGNATWEALPTTTLTVGATPIASGTVGRVLFEGTSNVLQQSANLFWNNTSGRLGIGTSSPTDALTVNGQITPLTDNANSLGTSSKRWVTVYTGQVSNSTDIEFGTGGGTTFIMKADGSAVMNDVSTPSTPASGTGIVYIRQDSLRFMNDAGTIFTVGTPTGGGGSSPTVGTYATRVGLTPSDGDEFFQTNDTVGSPAAKYYYLNGAWEYIKPGLKRMSSFEDDFYTVSGSYANNGNHYAIISSGAYSGVTGSNGGVARLSTSTSSSGSVVIYAGDGGGTAYGISLTNGAIYWRMKIKDISALSDGTNTYTIRAGLGNNSSGDNYDGVYFEYNSAISANWILKTANNSNRTDSTTAVAVSTGETTLEIFINAAGTRASYYINGTYIKAITTNLPTSTRYFGPLTRIAKSAGTTARYIDIDLIEYWQHHTTAR